MYFASLANLGLTVGSSRRIAMPAVGRIEQGFVEENIDNSGIVYRTRVLLSRVGS
jgi:hypothetical protein